MSPRTDGAPGGCPACHMLILRRFQDDSLLRNPSDCPEDTRAVPAHYSCFSSSPFIAERMKDGLSVHPEQSRDAEQACIVCVMTV